jgi:iron complex outermembrane receptor protein
MGWQLEVANRITQIFIERNRQYTPIKPCLKNMALKTQKRHFIYAMLAINVAITMRDAAAADTSAQTRTITELAQMSLEELVNVEITSVSKKPELLGDAATAIYVITRDDIRRSGAASLPEALRLAPNLQVARVSASGYAISARGLNGSNSSAPNKLLVLIDGRSVYTPLFSGVFWDVQDVMVEDIERIEVISGPGGTLWGVNAVNGVINVITRSAKETQGGLVALGSGNRGGDAGFRYGGALGADANYRIYGKYSDQKHTALENGESVNDAFHKNQFGFRVDWNPAGEQFTIEGNTYTGRENQPAPGAIAISGIALALGQVVYSGTNLTTRWTHPLDGGASLSFQAYYDHTERSVPPTFDEALDIVDFQFQHSLKAIGMHTVTWGANYRHSKDNVTNTSSYFAFLPADVTQTWPSVFAQDEMALRDDLRFTVGTRIERNVYTGNEILPNARLAWKFAPEQLLWTAASRAVRAPSRLDRDAYIPATPPFLLAGGPLAISEVAKVYEIGYRAQPVTRISYSVTAFHTDYDHLRTQEIDPTVSFLTFANDMEGKTDGVEMWGNYQALPVWRLSAGFTALREKLRLKSTSNDVAGPNAAGKDPAHTWQLRSTLNIGPGGEFDVIVRHVAALQNPAVPAYTAVDARFGWQVQRNLELSISGQNLFGNGHAEYSNVATRSRLERSVYAKAVWSFN